MTPTPAEFREEIEKLERKHAENPEGRYFVPLANAYRRSGDLRRAMSLLRQGLQKHPDYLSAHIVLGRCLADQGESGAAEAEFRHVLAVDPQNLIALRTLGELAIGQRNLEDARKWYQELLTVDPMNEDARRALENIEVSAALPAMDRRVTAQDDSPPWEWPAPEAHSVSSGEADAGAELASTPDNHESSFGTMIDLENPDSDPYSDTGSPVITETIAELYTRQGFYDRAADVYRELIRRRGNDPALEERLRQVTELAAGSGAGPAETPGYSVPMDQSPATTGVENFGDGVAGLESDPFASSFQQGFSTFEAEFSEPQRTSSADELAQLEPLFGAEPEAVKTLGLEVGFESGSSVIFAQDEELPTSSADAAPAWAEPQTVAASAESVTIKAYLNSVLSWKPGSPQASFDTAESTERGYGAFADEPADDELLPDDSLDIWSREGFVTDDIAPVGLQSDVLDREIEEALPLMDSAPLAEMDHSWLTGSAFTLDEPEPLASAPAAPAPAATVPEPDFALAHDIVDDELFPWELPATHPAAAAVETETTPVFAEDLPLVAEPSSVRDAPPETHVTDSDALAVIPTPIADVIQTTSAQPAAPPTPPADSAPDGAQEDDDLESFQTWLRSLKR